MNKYQVYIDSQYYDRSDGLYSTLGHNNRASYYLDSKPTFEESGFFSDDQYKEHSKQLVNALSEWAKQIKFVRCKYENGELQIEHEVLWKPAVPYIGRMLQHLDSAYKDSFPNIDQIQNQRNVICNEIRDLMTTYFDPIPHKPSYDMIVSTQIKKNCSHLKKNKDLDLDIDLENFYSHNKICQMIFEIVCGRRGIDLTLSPSSETGYNLVDKKIKTIARGDRASILKLKITIEQLVLSEEIRSIVSQYHKLKSRLDNHQDTLQFNYVVAQFYEYIHGGKVLGGPGSCDLCTDVEFKIK